MSIPSQQLGQRLIAELIGSMFLVIAAISPTILGYNILHAGVPMSVLYDGIAVGFILFALIEILGPLSGCHINPAVTIAMIATKDISFKAGCLYMIVQVTGGMIGMISSHLMFYHVVPTLITVSDVTRPSGCYFAEYLGTFLLIMAIYGCMRNKSERTGLVIGLFVGGSIITTSSTMFANPQVTIARIFTYAIAGIRPIDAAFFIIAEILGALTAARLSLYLYSTQQTRRFKHKRITPPTQNEILTAINNPINN